ncbi:hypothetical protein ACLMJK_006911 [Lecanora helva]
MNAEPPPNRDKALLARLNALKQSNVSFEPEHSAFKAPSEAQETPDTLIERFQDLYCRNATVRESNAAAQTETKDNDEPPSPTIEELLAELGPEEQFTVNDTDLQEADQLLAEAKRTLPEDIPSQGSKHLGDPEFEATERHSTASKEDQDEELEAEQALKCILDEAKIENDQEPAAPRVSMRINATPTFPSAPLDSFASLQFPPTPDSPLESTRLPSVPSTAPSRKIQARQKGFSDEEIDSWCIICCANAAVKCFGCDGDLYCWGCWREGHVGGEVGLEEKSHVWERVVKGRIRKV